MNNYNLKYSVPISIIETIETGETGQPDFTIEGVAINATTTDNNHKFLPEELMRATDSLNGVPLLKDHENSVDSVIGKVISSEFNVLENNIRFKAKIMDEGIKNKIKNGLLNTVSIGASIESLEEEDDLLIPRGIKFRELSIVAVPADEDATFQTFTGKDFNLALKEAYKSTSHSSSHSEDYIELNTKQEIMEDKKTETEVNELEALESKVDKLADQSKAQTDLLSDVLTKLKEADVDEEESPAEEPEETESESESEESKEEAPVEEQTEEVKAEEPKSEESEESEKSKESDEAEEEAEEEETEESNEPRIVESYRSFTVERNQKSLGNKSR
ncbi:MAG: hypothetical protein IH948_00700 [Bacteroidetes bacterium]|nr:hypothetical protein [Bacteroidota bacterium]